MDQNIQDILCNVKEYLKKLSDSERFFALKDHTHIKAHVTDFVHNNDHHSEEYVTQTNIDTAKNELETEIDKKSTVVFSRTLGNTAGKTTKIGQIKIDNNNPVEIYCEKNTYPTNVSELKDSTAHSNIGSSSEATQANINTKIDTALSGKAPTSHAVDASTYGKGTASVFGHVKIANNLTTTSTDSIALAAAQGKALKDSISSHNHGNLLNNGTITTSSNTANKVVITDTNNAVKVIDKLPADKVTHQDISRKVEMEDGKGLSTNDLTDARVHILDSVYEGARASKRPLGYLIESNRDTSNQPLIEIDKGTKLKVRLYESEHGNIITSKQNINYPDGLGITYIIVRDDFATYGGNHLIETGENGAEIAINTLNPGYYMMMFSFVGTDNFYPVYRTIILKVI